MSKIFNYQALERLDHLEALLVAEFDKIGHYDLMHFSEVTKGLIGTFDQRNKSCREALFATAKVEAPAVEETKEETKSAQPAPSTEGGDLLAMMMKKKQDAAKASAVKGGKKGPLPKT